MLTPNQEKYLNKIPESVTVEVKPFDPKTHDVANEIIGQVKNVAPGLQVLFMGASALGIAGQNDIDIYICSPREDFDKYLPSLKELFGENRPSISIIKWELQRGGFDVELYLTDPDTPSMQEQIQVFEILRRNPDLLKEYESIKKSSDGASFREYMRRKYEFFNKIL